MTPNTRDTLRDDCILAACNQGIGGSFNNRIAIITTIVGGVTTFDNHGGEGGAIKESINSYSRDAVRDSDRGEGGATIESLNFNARDTIRDGDRSEGGTLIESLTSNALYTARDSDRGQRRAFIESIISNARHWTIEGDDTLSVFVGVAYDVSTKDVGFIWCNHCAINRGI